MSMPYDSTTKFLLASRPADWLPYLGLPPHEVEVIDADLSTVTQAADRMLRVQAAVPWLIHLEFQAGHDTALSQRILLYNVLARDKFRLPVQSIVVLLSERADRASINGSTQHYLPDGRLYLDFAYHVVRVWEKPVEEVLSGGLGTLPLAPIAQVTDAELPGVVRRMEARLRREATPEEAGRLWAATNVLMGLRYTKQVAQQLLQGVQNMKESVTYQAIVEEGRAEGIQKGMEQGLEQGRVEEAQRLLLRLGTKRFGTLSEQNHAAITAIVSLTRLEELNDRLVDAESWQELLQDL